LDGCHPSGAVPLCHGPVKPASKNISSAAYRALSAIDRNETVDDDHCKV